MTSFLALVRLLTIKQLAPLFRIRIFRRSPLASISAVAWILGLTASLIAVISIELMGLQNLVAILGAIALMGMSALLSVGFAGVFGGMNRDRDFPAMSAPTLASPRVQTLASLSFSLLFWQPFAVCLVVLTSLFAISQKADTSLALLSASATLGAGLSVAVLSIGIVGLILPAGGPIAMAAPAVLVWVSVIATSLTNWPNVAWIQEFLGLFLAPASMALNESIDKTSVLLFISLFFLGACLCMTVKRPPVPRSFMLGHTLAMQSYCSSLIVRCVRSNTGRTSLLALIGYMALGTAVIWLLPIDAKSDFLKSIAIPLAFPAIIFGISFRGIVGARVPVDYLLGVDTLKFTFNYVAAANLLGAVASFPFYIILSLLLGNVGIVIIVAIILFTGLNLGLMTGAAIASVGSSTSILIASSFPAIVALIVVVNGSTLNGKEPIAVVLIVAIVAFSAACFLVEKYHWHSRERVC